MQEKGIKTSETTTLKRAKFTPCDNYACKQLSEPSHMGSTSWQREHSKTAHSHRGHGTKRCMHKLCTSYMPKDVRHLQPNFGPGHNYSQSRLSISIGRYILLARSGESWLQAVILQYTSQPLANADAIASSTAKHRIQLQPQLSCVARCGPMSPIQCPQHMSECRQDATGS